MTTVSALTLDGGKISPRQLLFILITVIISTADIFLPAIVAQLSGRDAWISVLLATVEALVVAAVAVALSLRFPNKTFVQISQIVLGRWPGWFLALFFIAGFYFIFTVNTVAQLGIILRAAFMPFTPILVFNAVIVAVAAYAVYHGIETIARLTELLMPVGIGVLLLVGLMILPEVNLEYYLPILENGVSPVLTGSLRMLPFLGEVVIIMMLMPYVNQPQKAAGIVFLALVLLGLLFLVGVLAIGVFGARQTTILTFPALDMVRYIEIGEFLEHLDAIVMTVWISGIYIKITVSYYITCIGIAQLANLNRYQKLIVPIGIIIASASIAWLGDMATILKGITYSWPSQGLLFELMIPLFMLLLAAARKLKENAGSKNAAGIQKKN